MNTSNKKAKKDNTNEKKDNTNEKKGKTDKTTFDDSNVATFTNPLDDV